MSRPPAAVRADTAAVLQAGEEGMAEERLGVRQQGIPLAGIHVGEAGKGLDWHGRESGASYRRRKAGSRVA
ncbi:hypothetical protein D3C76_1578840 [compost metagenome]